MKTEKILRIADQFEYFTFLNGNGISYFNHNFGSHLALCNNSKNTVKKIPKNPTKPVFGHICYEFKNQIEKLSSNNTESINFDEIFFYEPEFYFNPEKDKIPEKLKQKEIKYFHKKSNRKIKIKANISKKEYVSNVKKLKKHIINGDFYEVNYCFKFESKKVDIDPIEIYLKLNATSPMPFSALHKTKNKYAICASPERFLKRENNLIISQPIKGTIRKGKNKRENEKLKKQLLNDEKERAENLMIVDLVRNDLSKSGKSGSTKVEELFGIYEFKTINQMVSTISTIAKENIGNDEIIKNTFPMGSMTGAPKIKAMQVIEQYEKSKRGLYSGCIGYIMPNGDFDFNVVIRSILYDSEKKEFSFHVGSAITYDSDPEKEYEECLLKAESIMKVLNN